MVLDNWGREQRNKYLSMLDASFHSIVRQPGIGIACHYIRPGYRKYHVGRHLVFYRKTSKHIEIIRILHDSMDVESNF
ncbi:MAG: type II toxin-antitoxin system RelE/ParE family toxin [Proteobacteria bacterium]|nr:type II toxin-antitoxin system RelE/ParE family toxin [Pseudomonadota bacterium]